MESSKSWMKHIRKSFWNEPASRRGFHRPGDTQLSHAIGVLALASKHWRRVPWHDVRKDRLVCRSFLRAALFHDIGKAFDRDRHDIEGFRWMFPKDHLAAFFILQHMGRWGSSSNEKYELLREHEALKLVTPVNQYLSDMLSSCDYTHAVCFNIF